MRAVNAVLSAVRVHSPLVELPVCILFVIWAQVNSSALLAAVRMNGKHDDVVSIRCEHPNRVWRGGYGV